MKKIIQGIIGLAKKYIDYLENSAISFTNFILTFIFIIILRNFLEVFVYACPIESFIFLHYALSYIALAIALILFFSFVTKNKVICIAKVVLPSFGVLIIGPLLDLFFKNYGVYHPTYLLPSYHNNIALRFFTFFGDFREMGVTLGIRIELILVLLGVLIYLYIKTKSLIKSVFFTFLAYAIFFAFAALPIIINWVGLLFGFNKLSSFHRAGEYAYYLIILLLGIPLAYFADKGIFKVIIKNIRILRLLHYELMFVLGLFLGFKMLPSMCPDGIVSVLNDKAPLYVLFIPFTIIFAAIFSIITNDIEDRKIDKVSNKDRPLVISSIGLDSYKKISWVFLFITLFYAWIVDFKAFFIMALILGNYFLYSMPPLRLKRVPVLSKLAISFNSLLLVMLGYSVITDSLLSFPKPIMAVFLVCFTLAANFIDLKDSQGDRLAGIKTLPVILGPRKSKLIIGVFFIISYLVSALVLKQLFMGIVLSLLGVLQFYLINRKVYEEKYIFYVYLLSILFLIVSLI